MTKTTHEQTSPSDDPLEQVIFVLDDKQTAEFAELLAAPSELNEALRDVMDRTPPWEAGRL